MIVVIVAVVVYFAWRKFGATVKDAITNVTK
jgi:hypothetical protein